MTADRVLSAIEALLADVNQMAAGHERREYVGMKMPAETACWRCDSTADPDSKVGLCQPCTRFLRAEHDPPQTVDSDLVYDETLTTVRADQGMFYGSYLLAGPPTRIEQALITVAGWLDMLAAFLAPLVQAAVNAVKNAYAARGADA